MKKLFFAVALSFIAVASANAATVTFYLDQNVAAGTWQLSLKSSDGDNGGVATYGVALTGDILTLDHKSPRAGAAESQDGSLSGPIGFTVFRSADGAANKNIGGGQDSLAPTPFLIYGYGQTAGNFASLPGTPTPLGSNEGNNWLAKPIIASGTMTPGTGVKIDRGNALTLANVFAAGGQAATVAATLAFVPEPATFALAGMGLIGLVAARRRKA